MADTAQATSTASTAIVPIQTQIVPTIEPMVVVTPVVEVPKKNNNLLWAAGAGVLVLWILARQKG